MRLCMFGDCSQEVMVTACHTTSVHHLSARRVPTAMSRDHPNQQKNIRHRTHVLFLADGQPELCIKGLCSC